MLIAFASDKNQKLCLFVTILMLRNVVDWLKRIFSTTEIQFTSLMCDILAVGTFFSCQNKKA